MLLGNNGHTKGWEEFLQLSQGPECIAWYRTYRSGDESEQQFAENASAPAQNGSAIARLRQTPHFFAAEQL